MNEWWGLLGGEPAWLWVTAAWSGHILVFLLVAMHLLRHRREPTSALFWLLLTWFLPLFGALAYLAFGIYRIPRKGSQKRAADVRFKAERRALEDGNMPLAFWRSAHEALTAEPEDPDLCVLNRAMDGILEDYPLLGGNTVEMLVDGDEAYPAMLAAIRAARHHIHLQTFILANDAVGREFLDALAAKARAGVRVRLLYDRFGSTYAVLGGLFRRYRNIPNMELAGWTQANLLKRQFQFNLRNHRKLLVVDGVVAFTGGVNIGEANCSQPGHPAIRDYHFRLTGPAVHELQFSFLRDWYYFTGAAAETLLVPEHFPASPSSGHARVRVVNSGPASEMEAIRDVFFLSIISARHRVLAMTPYFAPTADLLQAFRAAARRGVDVCLLMPQENNHPYSKLAGQAYYDDLLSAGVRIYERRPPFIHAKAMLIDDGLALVGSANLDIRSLRLNYETNLAIYDPATVLGLQQRLEDELAQSHEITLGQWRRRPHWRRSLENLCNLFSPVL
ncbi:MAG: cardiolipin synthase [Lentisphaeria bacterium]